MCLKNKVESEEERFYRMKEEGTWVDDRAGRSGKKGNFTGIALKPSNKIKVLDLKGVSFSLVTEQGQILNGDLLIIMDTCNLVFVSNVIAAQRYSSAGWMDWEITTLWQGGEKSFFVSHYLDRNSWVKECYTVRAV